MGGISIPQVASGAIVGAGAIVVYAESAAGAAAQAAANNALVGTVSGLDKQFRPPQWSAGLPAMTMLTVPAQYVQTKNMNADTYIPGAVLPATQSTPTPPNAIPQYLVFDGVMRLGHSQPMTPTEHPIQDAANFSEHIRANQAVVTLDVIMTDVLPAYAAGQWVGNPSKSISCFQTLDSLRLNRIPLTLTTRLKTYWPMFIIDVLPDETVKTRYGFRGTVTFKQLFLFNVATQAVSARPQTSDSTTIGQTQAQSVPAGVTAQNEVLDSDSIQLYKGLIDGAGNWSSNNAGTLNAEGK